MSAESDGEAETVQEDASSDHKRSFRSRLNKSSGHRSVSHLQLFGTKHFVRGRDAKHLTTTTAVAALADLLSHNVPFAVVAAGFAELVGRYERLTPEEMGVFDVLRRLAQGGSIYKFLIAEEKLLEALDPDLSDDDRRRLLANMKSRGLLEEGAGKWRAVW